MRRVLALVEGPTEQAFVKEVLAPRLGARNVFLTASLLGKPGRRQGGIRRWESARRDVFAALKQDVSRCCTTMFDYYGMPVDWPGRLSSSGLPPSEAAARVEQALSEDVRQELGASFALERFIPYVQMHEFEALLFSDPGVLARVLGTPNATSTLQDAVDSCGSPEGIDDSPVSAPSKRILALAPRYEKPVDGIVAARQIGLERMKAACPHFHDWLMRLEGLDLQAKS